MKGNPALIYTFAVLGMLFWGMSFVWTKIVFRYYEPITTIFIRLLLSALILYIFRILFIRNERVRREDFRLFFVSALFSPFFYFIGESFGLKEVSSTIASVIIATIPVFTPFIAYLTINERITKLNYLGMLVSFMGVIIMLLKKDLSFNASARGMLLLSFAVAAALGYGISIKKLSLKYNPITIISLQNFIGAIYFLPFFLWFDFSHAITVRPTVELWRSLFLLSVFASSGAYILYTYVVRHIGVSKANIFSNLIPVFTAIFSYFILAEEFTTGKILGMIIVILGVLLAQANKIRRKEIMVT